MRQLLFLFAGLISTVSIPIVTNAQCVICFSMEQALLEPSRVEYLDLSAKGLENLPDDIGKFTNLRELDLSDNMILEIDFSKLSLPNLTSLKISNNQGFNGMALSGLTFAVPELKHLQISNCGMTSVSSEIGKLNHLEELDLSNNSLKLLPQEIDRMNELKKIDLSNNDLTYQSLFLSELWNIEEIRIEGNEKLNLIALSESLAFKDNIRFLRLSVKETEKIFPKSFKDLQVKQIELINSQVESINMSITTNDYIDYFTFNNCELLDSSRIYSWIDNFKSLKTIEFKNMRIPGGIKSLKNVDRIIFNNCSFADIDELSEIKPQIEVVSVNSDIQNGDFIGNAQRAKEVSKPGSNYVEKNNLPKIIETPIQEFSIQADEPTKLDLGFSSYEIPSNAFLTENGDIYSGKVDLKITEYNDPIINALSGVPMIYNDGTDRVFASSGMIDFRAFDQNGKVLKPNPESIIQVELVDIQPSVNSDLYIYDSISSNWNLIGKPISSNLDSIRKFYVDSLNSVADSDLVPIKSIPIIVTLKYKNNKYDPTRLEFKATNRKKILKNDPNGNYYLNNVDEEFLCEKVWKIDTLVWTSLDSLLCASKKDQIKTLRKLKNNKKYYYKDIPRLITDLSVTPNMERDNFVLSFNYKNEQVRVPVYQDMTGSAEKIQSREKKNYGLYLKKVKESQKEEDLIDSNVEQYIKMQADVIRKRQVEFLVANYEATRETREKLRFGLSSFGLVNCDYFSRNVPTQTLVLDSIGIDQDGNQIYIPGDIRNIMLNDNSYVSTNQRQIHVFDTIKSISLFAIGMMEIAIIKGWTKLSNGLYRPEIERFSTENMTSDQIRDKILSSQ